MPRSTFELDIRGMLQAEDLISLLDLTPQKRRRLMNNVTKRVRSLSRQRIREQRNLDGSPFEARKDTSNRKKMEAGLGKLLEVVRLSDSHAELGWRNRLTSWVASQQHNGAPERITARQVRELSKVPPGTAATAKQAKRLRQLGYKVARPMLRDKKRKILMRPTAEWITQHLSYPQAGLLIRILDDERKASSGATSWEIKLPSRQFLGASDSETKELVNLVLRQIITAPR